MLTVAVRKPVALGWLRGDRELRRICARDCNSRRAGQVKCAGARILDRKCVCDRGEVCDRTAEICVIARARRHIAVGDSDVVAQNTYFWKRWAKGKTLEGPGVDAGRGGKDAIDRA